jgi:transcriptional regulator with PAS, ATPase and Fis domain
MAVAIFRKILLLNWFVIMRESIIERILLSFIGSQDPFSRDNDDGPILTMAANWSVNHFFLLHTNDQKTCDNAKTTASVLQERHPEALVELYPVSIDDPTNYPQLLSAMREACRILLENQVPREYFVSVASGTPAMHACWLLLTASGEIHANILYLRRSKYIQDGQPLISEINPRAREFPRILPHATMDDLPDVTDVNLDDALNQAGIIGDAHCLRKEIDRAVRYSTSDLPVLIFGESGTGKELFARLIHKTSKRRGKEFFAINCGAISSELVESELFGHVKGAFTGATSDKKGAFGHADGGLLFLDEIGDLPLSAQVKMLRVLQEKEITPIGGVPKKIDVRVIAATHRNLENDIAQGRFRADLFYRLNVLYFTLPPLRDRGSDIGKIALAILDHCNQRDKKNKQFTQSAMDEMFSYDWPGNARELVNSVERAFVVAKGRMIDANDLWNNPRCKKQNEQEIPVFHEGFSLENHLAKYRKKIYTAAIEQTNSKQSEVARILGISTQAVSKYLKDNDLNSH